MKTITTPTRPERSQAVSTGPAVTIILPFEPKMSKPALLAEVVRQAVENVEMELLQNHCDDMSMLVIQKLKLLSQSLNYNTYNKSVALFVSPVFEKVLYLDFEVVNTISIAGSFKVRDLVKAKKSLHEYLVLFVSHKEAHIYQGKSQSFTRVVSNTPSGFHPGIGIPYQPLTLHDPASREDQQAKLFLQHIDQALYNILHSYRVPLLVVGTAQATTQFKKMTQHETSVVEYLQVESAEITGAQLKRLVDPLVRNWESLWERYLLNQLWAAHRNDRLATGMQEVRERVINGKGKLLLVEECFPSPENCGDGDGALFRAIGHYSKYSYVQDAVDEVIEKLLERGAAIEIVEEGLLQDCQHIALIH